MAVAGIQAQKPEAWRQGKGSCLGLTASRSWTAVAVALAESVLEAWLCPSGEW